MDKKKWFDQIDLLRLVLMYMIVAFHLVSKGGVILSTEFLSVHHSAMCLIYTLTSCAVNTYALISGYVGVDNKGGITGFLLLWLRVVWYGVLINLGFAIFLPGSVSLVNWAKAIFPVSFKAYWYFSAYFIVVLFRPLLNAAVRNLSKARIGGMIAVLLVFVCIPAVLNRDVFQLAKGFSPWWLMILYLVGAYIRLYGLFRSVKTRWLWLAFALANIIELIRRQAYNYLYFRAKGEIPFHENMTNYLAITTTVSAICLFLIFERAKLKDGHMANLVRKLAPLSFSVYLIHVNALVWDNLLSNSFTWIADLGIVPGCLAIFGISALIFIGCLLIDMPREALFKGLRLRSRIESAKGRLTGCLTKAFP